MWYSIVEVKVYKVYMSKVVVSCCRGGISKHALVSMQGAATKKKKKIISFYSMSSQSIILRMQVYLLQHVISPNLGL